MNKTWHTNGNNKKLDDVDFFVNERTLDETGGDVVNYTEKIKVQKH